MEKRYQARTTVRRLRVLLAVAVAGVALAVAGCGATASPSATPIGELCSSSQSLATSVSLGRLSMDAARAGDTAAAQRYLDDATQAFDQSQALRMHAGALVDQQGATPQNWGARSAEVDAAQAAVDLALAALNPLAPPASVDARARLLDAAGAKINAIELPDSCTTAIVPTAAS
jgi:hypothetical protein